MSWHFNNWQASNVISKSQKGDFCFLRVRGRSFVCDTSPQTATFPSPTTALPWEWVVTFSWPPPTLGLLEIFAVWILEVWIPRCRGRSKGHQLHIGRGKKLESRHHRMGAQNPDEIRCKIRCRNIGMNLPGLGCLLITSWASTLLVSWRSKWLRELV